MDSPAITSTPRTMIEAAKPIKDEDVFETTNDSFTTSVQHQMQTSEGRKAFSQHLGPLGQEYIGDFLNGGGKNKIVDIVHGIRLDKNGIMMLGSKKFDIDSSDHIIIDGAICWHTGSLRAYFQKTCIRKTINENTKAYCWLQTCIDAITLSIVIYGVTVDTSIDMYNNCTVIKRRIDDWKRITLRTL